MNGFEQYLAPFIFGGPVFNFTVGTNEQPALEHPGGYVAMQCGLEQRFLNDTSCRQDIHGE